MHADCSQLWRNFVRYGVGEKVGKEEGHHPGRKEAVFLWMEDAVRRRGKTWPAPRSLFLCAACVRTPKILFVSAIRLAAVLY